MADSPIIQCFRCPSCNRRVSGTLFEIQTWSEEHCFDCGEDRAKIYPLTKDGRIAVREES